MNIGSAVARSTSQSGLGFGVAGRGDTGGRAVDTVDTVGSKVVIE